jgi:glycerate kinase
MKIVVAPNALKGTLSASEAARAIAEGICRSAPRAHVVQCPIADGGDGTREILVQALHGETRSAPATDPFGRERSFDFGLVEQGRTAVIDVATASGLALVDVKDQDPLRASSYGTGQLLLAALAAGAERVILGVGGSATVDAGAGLLAALGVRFLDARGRPFTPSGGSLVDIADLDASALDERVRGASIVVACDVENPLLGEAGAARVYGPQKGATPEAVELLEHGLEHVAAVMLRATGRDIRSTAFGGAAGGLASGVWAVLGAKLVPGIDLVLDYVGFDVSLKEADAVVTAEGRLDPQSLRNNGSVGVARRARRFAVPTLMIAGSIAEGFDLARTPFEKALVLAETPADIPGAQRRARERLTEVAERVPAMLERSERNGSSS